MCSIFAIVGICGVVRPEQSIDRNDADKGELCSNRKVYDLHFDLGIMGLKHRNVYACGHTAVDPQILQWREPSLGCNFLDLLKPYHCQQAMKVLKGKKKKQTGRRELSFKLGNAISREVDSKGEKC